MKGSRLLLLCNYDTLGPEKKNRLDELLEINRNLSDSFHERTVEALLESY
jgi:hypothetical protein